MAAPTSIHPSTPDASGILAERRLLGIVLLVVGGILAAGFVVPDVDRFTLIGASLTTLIAFVLTREYGYAIPAGITGGLGLAVLAITGATFGAAATPAVLFLAMAGGFTAVWLLGLAARPRVVHPWPLVPAAILGSLGLAFAAGQPGAVSWVQFAIAALITLAGIGLVLRRGETAA